MAFDTMLSNPVGWPTGVIGLAPSAVSWRGAACYGVHFGRSATAYHVSLFLDAGDGLELRRLGSSFT